MLANYFIGRTDMLGQTMGSTFGPLKLELAVTGVIRDLPANTHLDFSGLLSMRAIGSSLIALCVAWVTVGSTAAKAASAKPVLALRYE